MRVSRSSAAITSSAAGELEDSVTVSSRGPAGPDASSTHGGVTTGMWSAKHLGEHTALIGTPYYAPVEQFGGESPDRQSDIYNVSTVLFECATGVLPWPGKTLLEVFQAKLDRSEPSMKRRAPKCDVPAALESAIVKGLLADRDERYVNATELRESLAAVALEE